MMRLDVAVVGFVVFTLVAPIGGGYLAAWLVASAGNAPFVALFAGGTSAAAIAAAVGAALGLALSIGFTSGSLLDAFVGAWPDNQPLAVDPRWQLMNLNGRFARKPSAEIQEGGPVALGGAVGWLGSAVAAMLLGGMALAAWPTADPIAVARLAVGSGTATDWVVAAFPVIVRVIVASVIGILAGAAWSTFGGPAGQLETLDSEVQRDLDDLSVVDAPGPGVERPGS